jgi:hypothetical protein
VYTPTNPHQEEKWEPALGGEVAPNSIAVCG